MLAETIKQLQKSNFVDIFINMKIEAPKVQKEVRYGEGVAGSEEGNR